MNTELLGSILDVVGKIMIAYTAIRVHFRFWKEHRIDDKVFYEMRREQIIGVLGIVFLIAGFLLQLPGKI